MQERLLNYKHKCKVLKQIHSSKALKYGRLNLIQNFFTVFISAFITFIGFSGVDKLYFYIKVIWGTNVPDEAIIQMTYNILVFFLFFLVISHLVFQIGKSQVDSEKAISLLSSLTNEIDDIIDRNDGIINPSDIDSIRYKYVTITQTIPPNTDKDYINALKSMGGKKIEKLKLKSENFVSMKTEDQEGFIIELARNNKTVKRILDILYETNHELYLGGGIIRNLVWDRLHNYSDMTPIEDIDVIYFDKLSATKKHDEAIEEKLKSTMPNMKWSVKNQARMHKINFDEEYISITDAIEKWPDTVSAILIRKNDNDKYELLAPFGYDDLFRLIIEPTPHFMNRLDRYRERITEKKWLETWDKLKAFYFYDVT